MRKRARQPVVVRLAGGIGQSEAQAVADEALKTFAGGGLHDWSQLLHKELLTEMRQKAIFEEFGPRKVTDEIRSGATKRHGNHKNWEEKFSRERTHRTQGEGRI